MVRDTFNGSIKNLTISINNDNLLQTGLVNKPNIFYRLENISKYQYGILQKTHILVLNGTEDYIILMIFS